MNMELFLSKQCESLTGSLGRGFGYYVRSTKKGRFFAQRSKHSVPPDGHWRFIVTCAELAQNKLHITDIRVHWMELSDALYEARHFVTSRKVRNNAADAIKTTYSASDIINLKKTFGL